jgi:hypothetical protein
MPLEPPYFDMAERRKTAWNEGAVSQQLMAIELPDDSGTYAPTWQYGKVGSR